MGLRKGTVDRLTKAVRKRVSRAGGIARKAKLTPQERSEIAKKAAAARWKLPPQAS
jgi:hypothetical protein